MKESQRVAALLLLVLAAALALALGRTVSRLREGPAFGGPAAYDERAAAEAVRRLVAGGTGLLDSDADPDVGRRLLPSLEERAVGPVRVTTNAWGFRERPLAEKAPGVSRVVLLGDSLVHGAGVSAGERFGALLEGYLAEHAPGRVECLHFGVPGWNLRAAGSFLRRALARIDPDLVVHLSRPDDLGDVRGVRGFGGEAAFTPQDRAGAGDAVAAGRGGPCDPLVRALDHEGRERYARAADDVRRLAVALRAWGSRYLFVPCGWPPERLAEHFDPVLEARELAPVAGALAQGLPLDRPPQERPEESGESAESAEAAARHAELAELVYGLVRERGLLPGLFLPARSAADAALGRFLERGLAAGAPPRCLEDAWASALSFGADGASGGEAGAEPALQVHGGVRAGGAVAGRASLILANPAPGHSPLVLVVRGRRLGRGELEGAARVLVEGRAVGRFGLEGEEPIEERFALPADLAARSFLNVRFQADDWVYVTAGGACASFRLSSVALVE